MGETKNRQKAAKEELDSKLDMSRPTRDLLEELAVQCVKEPCQQSKFQYAFALSKSVEPSELRYAIGILDSLVVEGFEHQVDCMYGAATALYTLGEYSECRSRCEAILRTQPETRIAKELHLATIEAEEERERENLKKAAIGSAVAAVAIGVLGIAGSMLAKR